MALHRWAAAGFADVPATAWVVLRIRDPVADIDRFRAELVIRADVAFASSCCSGRDPLRTMRR